MAAVASSRWMLHNSGGWGYSPLYVKRFECLEKRYINVTNNKVIDFYVTVSLRQTFLVVSDWKSCILLCTHTYSLLEVTFDVCVCVREREAECCVSVGQTLSWSLVIVFRVCVCVCLLAFLSGFAAWIRCLKSRPKQRMRDGACSQEQTQIQSLKMICVCRLISLGRCVCVGVCVCVCMHTRGVTVHKHDGSVWTSVLTSQFCMVSAQQGENTKPFFQTVVYWTNCSFFK